MKIWGGGGGGGGRIRDRETIGWWVKTEKEKKRAESHEINK